jgi:predicted Zn-dependent protease with MMP-like domain
MDDITQAVEELIAAMPADYLKDKALLQAFMNWFRSQEVGKELMCNTMATLLGLFIGTRADDKADLKKGLSIYAHQIKAYAQVSLGTKQAAS